MLDIAEFLAGEYALNQVLAFGKAADEWGIDSSTLRKSNNKDRFFDLETKLSGGVWLVTRSAMERLYGPPKVTPKHVAQLEEAGFKKHAFKQGDCWFKVLNDGDLLRFFEGYDYTLQRIEHREFTHLYLEIYPMEKIALCKEFNHLPAYKVIRELNLLIWILQTMIRCWNGLRNNLKGMFPCNW